MIGRQLLQTSQSALARSGNRLVRLDPTLPIPSTWSASKSVGPLDSARIVRHPFFLASVRTHGNFARSVTSYSSAALMTVPFGSTSKKTSWTSSGSSHRAQGRLINLQSRHYRREIASSRLCSSGMAWWIPPCSPIPRVSFLSLSLQTFPKPREDHRDLLEGIP